MIDPGQPKSRMVPAQAGASGDGGPSRGSGPLPPPLPPPIAAPEQFDDLLRDWALANRVPRLASAVRSTSGATGSTSRRILPAQLPRPVARQQAPVHIQAAQSEPATVAERVATRPFLQLRPLQQAPPWLISLLLHTAILLLLGLLWLPQIRSNVLHVTAVFADKLGAQTEIDTPSVSMDAPQPEDPVVTPDQLEPVEEPRLEPQPIEATAPDATQIAEAEPTVPDVGLALTGRDPGKKASLLAAYGGNELTESAVSSGLEWLRRNQQKDGTWSLEGPYSDGAALENRTAATAMALLAFQAAGHTHRAGKYRPVITKGIRALVKMQNREGDFFQGSIGHHRLYSQAQAMIAVCELYGMTNDSALRLAAERSVEYAVKTQDSLGGWRYQPGFDSDTSVTGWFVMGLQSARMAGIEVPSDTLQRINEFLDRVASSNQSRYAYQEGMEATYSMTAEALLCRQYLGWQKDDSRLNTGVNMILAYPMDWADRDAYYWYYATQVLHHLHDARWMEWNDSMREMLPEHQTKSGPERGSWSPMGDRWGSQGGRLYVTCLHLYMLEVYYRHLPLYQ